ncbi:MAG: hypothetical protein ACO3RV_02260 [Luteolibacter sp.]
MESQSAPETKRGFRYTTEQKNEILAWVDDYDAKNGRGGASAAAKHFGVSLISIGNWKKRASGITSPKGSKSGGLPTQIDERQFMKVLAGRGFKYRKLINDLTGEVIEESKDERIEALNLKFEAIPASGAEHSAIYVTQTSPSIQVSMTLDRLLEMARVKP